MAKKKSQAKNPGQQAPISPERFMREKARKLPVGKCYITSHWKEAGKSNLIVTRLRPNGNMVAGVFLVDTFCLGVKDAFYFVNLEPDRLESYLTQFREGPGFEEIGYNEAHNTIYGAVAYAQDAGIKAVELLPEIKAVFDTGCVDLTVAGNFAAVSRDINAGTGIINDDRYSLPDIYDQAHRIIKALSKN